MTRDEIVQRYERAVATQKRRLIIRCVMAFTIITTAIFRALEIEIFNQILLIFYVALSAFFLYSFTIGRKTGAAKDFKAIAEHYMAQDKNINKVLTK